jgi:hypothetical protein
MRLLDVLTGLRNGRRDARGCGGMLIVMLALSGWLAPRSNGGQREVDEEGSLGGPA